MRSIDLLMRQHRDVEQLLLQVRSPDGADRIQHLGKLAELLTIHTALEEQHFYPVVRQHGLAEAADRSTREHAEVRELVGEILEMKRRDPRLNEVLGRLDAAVRRHVEEEERVLFPKVEQAIDLEALEAAGADMARALDELRRQELLKIAEDREAPVQM